MGLETWSFYSTLNKKGACMQMLLYIDFSLKVIQSSSGQHAPYGS